MSTGIPDTMFVTELPAVNVPPVAGMVKLPKNDLAVLVIVLVLFVKLPFKYPPDNATVSVAGVITSPVPLLPKLKSNTFVEVEPAVLPILNVLVPVAPLYVL